MAILHPIIPPPVDPKVYFNTIASVASGASTVIDCLEVGSSKKGKLMGLIVTSSVSFKAELKTVTDGVSSNNKAVWYAADGAWEFKPPATNFITVFGTQNIGMNGFRVLVTNLGIDTADISAVFYYDED